MPRRDLKEEFRDVLIKRPDLLPFRQLARPIINDRRGGQLLFSVGVEIEIGGVIYTCYANQERCAADPSGVHGTIDAYHLALREILRQHLPMIHPQLIVDGLQVVGESRIAVSSYDYNTGRATARQLSVVVHFRDGRDEWPMKAEGGDLVDAACDCILRGYQFWAWRREQELTRTSRRVK